MNIDTDKLASESLFPWNLGFTINGQTYFTRAANVGEISKLSKLGGSPGEALELVGTLFLEPRPNLNALDPCRCKAIVTAYVRELNAWLAWISPAAAAAGKKFDQEHAQPTRPMLPPRRTRRF